MTPPRRALSLTGTIDAVPAASRWVRDLAAELGLSDDDTFRLDLCLSELVTNIASYGTVDGTPPAIEIEVTPEADAVRVHLSDDGIAFDPLQMKHREPDADLADAIPGGHGIHLVREFSDAVRYEHAGGRNVLEFVLRATPPSRDS
jgi:anti-sigma regulatory factor (Ser/Thr protein kinase)